MKSIQLKQVPYLKIKLNKAKRKVTIKIPPSIVDIAVYVLGCMPVHLYILFCFLTMRSHCKNHTVCNLFLKFIFLLFSYSCPTFFHHCSPPTYSQSPPYCPCLSPLCNLFFTHQYVLKNNILMAM